MNTLVFGEILWDIIDGEAHLGGAPLNFAAHVRRCGHHSAIISALGNDDRGENAMKLVRDLDVDTTWVQKSDKPTGCVPVSIINGQPVYDILPNVAFDHISDAELSLEGFSDFDLFYFGSLIQRSSSSRKALCSILNRCDFKHIFYDVNLRKDCYTKEIIQHSLGYCTILKVNDEEVSVISNLLFGQPQSFMVFCHAISENHPQIKTIIITAGGDGAYVYSKGQLINVPTEPIKVVDTVGAGDSFSAAFACVYFSTSDSLKAAQIANKIGGFVASSAGPIPQYSDDLRQLLGSI